MNNTDSVNTIAGTEVWQLKALTAALGELTLTIDDSLSIGRGSDNDVVLGSKQVSRNHAVLSLLDGQLYVKDLDSSNGTFINDRRIEGNQSSLLQTNDTIGFASFSFQVQTSAVTTEAAASSPVPSNDSVANVLTDTDQPAMVNALSEENVVKENSIEESSIEESSIEENSIEESSAKPTTVSEPVVKQTGIEEILPVVDQNDPSSQTIEPVLQAAAPASVSDDTTVTSDVPASTATESKAVTTTESASNAIETDDHKPDDHKPDDHKPDDHEPPVEPPAVRDTHDKTTKTALQEEADPDVLRAKQAATAQFSGTANLSQSRDLGTDGNNAMDQAIDNPANAGQVEKKPSGGWFIWVFVTLLIIGLALWLFNMG